GGRCIRRRSNRGLNRREQCPPAPAVPWWLYRRQGDEQRQADLPLDLFFRTDSRFDILARKGEHDAREKTDQHRQDDHYGPRRLALALRGYRLVQHLEGRFIARFIDLGLLQLLG